MQNPSKSISTCKVAWPWPDSVWSPQATTAMAEAAQLVDRGPEALGVGDFWGSELWYRERVNYDMFIMVYHGFIHLSPFGIFSIFFLCISVSLLLRLEMRLCLSLLFCFSSFPAFLLLRFSAFPLRFYDTAAPFPATPPLPAPSLRSPKKVAKPPVQA